MTLVTNGKLFGKIHYAFVIMVSCCLVQAFGMGLILNCGSLFYVPVCEDLGFLRSEISTYMTGYFIGTTLITPLAGKLLSQYNIRIVMATAIVVLSGSVIALSFSTEIWQWQLSGFMIGAAGSCIFVLPAASLIGNWFVKRRGTVYGIVMACSSISSAIFSFVINSLIYSVGWRLSYVFVGVLSLVVILPCSLVMRRSPIELGIAPYGYQPESEEKRNELPVMRGVSVKTAVFSLAFCCLFAYAGIATFIHGGIEQHMPGYIQSIGFTASFATLIVSAESVGSVMDKLFMGWLNDKIGVKKTTIIELILVFIGIGGFIYFKNPLFLILAALLFGMQDSLMSVSLPLLIREIFGSKNYTQIHAWIRTGVGIFGSFSGVLVGMSYDTTGSFVPAFSILMGSCVVGIGCVVLTYWAKKRLTWTSAEKTAALPSTPTKAK